MLGIDGGNETGVEAGRREVVGSASISVCGVGCSKSSVGTVQASWREGARSLARWSYARSGRGSHVAVQLLALF